MREHLKYCAPCFKRFDFEKTYQRFIEMRAVARKAPEALRRKIMESLLEENGESPENDGD